MKQCEMKTRSILLALAVCMAAVASSFAANPNMGTWKLNEAKSKFPAGAGKNTTVVYEADGDKIKVTVEGVDASGKPTHNEWTGMMDGKDYPLMGDPGSDTRSYKIIDAHTTELTNKKDGKVTVTGKIVISADGKSRTVTISGTDASGKKVKYTAVYEKQ
jgi:endonuclease YncB( thermonuclease family)